MAKSQTYTLLCTGHDPIQCTPPRIVARPKAKLWVAPPVRPPYAYESERLESFAGWPSTAEARPRDLAKVGFYYMGQQDLCACFACDLRLYGWQSSHSPAALHLRHMPRCKVALEQDTNNVPLEQDDEARDFSSGLDGLAAAGIHTDSSAANNPEADDAVDGLFDGMITELDSKPQRQRKVKLEDRKEEFRTRAKRLESFKGRWPKEEIVPVADLAKYGFYYGGTKDRVICAYCGIILLGFVPGDSAYGEHFKHAGKCAFLKCISDPMVERPPEMKDEEHLRETPAANLEDAGSGPSSLDDAIDFVLGLGYQRPVIDAALEDLKSRRGKEKLWSTTDLLDAVINTTSKSESKERGSDQDKGVDKELKKLKAENRRLRMKCYMAGCNRMANMVLLPCKHLVACHQCSPEIQFCPECGKHVLAGLKTYLI